ncbi:MAG: hypothetical protein ACFB15_17005 [Cyclobacteriaceae bacterium]
MRHWRGTLWLSFVLIIGSIGCSTTINRQGEHVSVEQFDSLRTTYYRLNDSLNYAWNSLKLSDEEKLVHLDQLIKELDKDDLVGADTLNFLEQMVKELREIRFDSITVANASQVQKYDSLTGVISDSLVYLTDHFPEGEENPAVLYLTDKIISENSSVALYRLRYDQVSRDFNRFIEENKELMSSLDSTGQPVFRRPMFRLVNDPAKEVEPK